MYFGLVLTSHYLLSISNYIIFHQAVITPLLEAGKMTVKRSVQRTKREITDMFIRL